MSTDGCYVLYVTSSIEKKKAVQTVLDEIKNGIEDLDDSNGLDRILALLTQASASIKAAVSPRDNHNQVKEFEKKEHFFPRQKNEIQKNYCQSG